MTTEATETKDYLGMSDADFLNLNAPAEATPAPASDDNKTQEAAPGSVAAEEQTQNAEQTADDAAAETDEQKAAREAEEAAKAAAPPADADPAAEKPAGDPAPGSADAAAADPAKVEADKAAADAKADPKAAPAADATKKDEPKADAKPVDLEAFYKQVMAPFKANGRTIEIKSPEEVIRLMQMGAGFGRKLQSLQPALKTLKMLEKADLLDEGKLSFLIDINNKNPDAIKKLIKDSGIDPLDLNIGDNASYTPKSHAVSDKEMAFHSALEDVQSLPGGNETVRIVNQTWDKESKAALWESPELLGVIQSQRENGIYDQIAAEIDRQRLLGQIPANTPFLKAYKLAGDHLQATNGFKLPQAQAPIDKSGDTPQPQVIATRTAAPKPQVQNGEKAEAAASTKVTPKRAASAPINPLQMADDEFLKQFEGRL
jgi:hypothetical protein